MKCSGGILKNCNLKIILFLNSYQSLNGIGSRLDLRFSGMYHPCNGPTNPNRWIKGTNFLNNTNIGSCLVMIKDFIEVSFYFSPALHLAAIETNQVSIFGKQAGIFVCIAIIPTCYQFFVY